MKNQEELKKLVDGCVKNNRRAQEELFKLFYGKMLGVCLRYMSDRDTAQEVLQQGFIKVFEKIGVFDFKGSLEGWIRRIVTNTAIDAIRKSKRNPYLSDDDQFFKDEVVNEFEQKEEMNILNLRAEAAMNAIQELSPGYRAVFNLYVIEDYSHKEIADKLGISEGTSKSNLAKAKMNLQKILKRKYTTKF
ncbi:MAG: RNA polymerase sigma factor [Crocinitomicaceae bacterium]|nr:RNA polymerase sigma factor [Crocinitomicaceae bacterium]